MVRRTSPRPRLAGLRPGDRAPDSSWRDDAVDSSSKGGAVGAHGDESITSAGPLANHSKAVSTDQPGLALAHPLACWRVAKRLPSPAPGGLETKTLAPLGAGSFSSFTRLGLGGASSDMTSRAAAFLAAQDPQATSDLGLSTALYGPAVATTTGSGTRLEERLVLGGLTSG